SARCSRRPSSWRGATTRPSPRRSPRLERASLAAPHQWYEGRVNAPDLFDRAEHWIQHDPDPATRAELTDLVARVRAGAAKAQADLADRSLGRLEFGTAGLRALIGAGENRMNRTVVLRTSHGLGKYLLAHDEAAAREHGVVVGYDGRRMGREFAEDTA